MNHGLIEQQSEGSVLEAVTLIFEGGRSQRKQQMLRQDGMSGRLPPDEGVAVRQATKILACGDRARSETLTQAQAARQGGMPGKGKEAESARGSMSGAGLGVGTDGGATSSYPRSADPFKSIRTE